MTQSGKSEHCLLLHGAHSLQARQHMHRNPSTARHACWACQLSNRHMQHCATPPSIEQQSCLAPCTWTAPLLQPIHTHVHPPFPALCRLFSCRFDARSEISSALSSAASDHAAKLEDLTAMLKDMQANPAATGMKRARVLFEPASRVPAPCMRVRICCRMVVTATPARHTSQHRPAPLAPLGSRTACTAPGQEL